MSRTNLVLAATLVAVLGVAAGGAAMLFAEDAPKTAPAESPKVAKIRRLLAASGAEAASRQSMDGVLEQFKSNPMLPPGFLEKFRAKMDPKKVIEATIPTYEKHLDDATLDAAIAYFESDAGKHYVAKQPAILQESMAIGGKLGQEMALECIAELERESEAK